MKYRVRLSESERSALRRKVSSGVAAAREVRHAQVLLKVDSSPGVGPALSDGAVAEQVGFSSRTVQRIRQAYAKEGMEAALARKPQPPRPGKRKVTDLAEARLIALACSEAPEGRSRWTLRLLADRAVELRLVEGSLSHESVRQALKKTSSGRT